MSSREMVKERATAGKGALSAWLWRCRVSMGEVYKMQNLCDA